ncbi:DUF4252 domain-containing protein [Candidatus Poribacteria bacterium]|nr:DUF4252 domain-containing protein [Candidatus Poribacteria bacterium]
MNRILFLPLILFIIVGMIGCGCCLVGGGDTGRANRLDYAHKKMGIGVGGPGWSVLTRLGARFVQEEEPGAAMLIRGVKRIQISEFTLEKSTEARREEIFNLYAELMRKQGWRLLTRVYEDKHDSCIFAQYDEDSFRGIFVVAIQGKEMHVIKIVGDIRPEAFAELNIHLGQHGARLPVAK